MMDIANKKNYNFNKNQKKKFRKKENKLKKIHEESLSINENESNHPTSLDNFEDFPLNDGFERFNMDLEAKILEKEEQQKLKFNEDLPRKAIAVAILESNHSKEELEDGAKMSRKKWKKLNRISIGDLKIRVKKPDLVEPWDNCSSDPIFLLELKGKRNTVPIPRHWCTPGKYLQSKRGFVKPPFKLPKAIADTGIMEMRQTADDKESEKSLKNKMKDKIRPKVGLVDISYDKLYNAFFVDLTKPDLTKFGDIYYQGKELEAKRKENRPGIYSDDLRVALGMPTGANCDKFPPPWLISQQRYGPPPSYPNLKIPGLNKGLPPGCSFGYHIGGWGKPPIDDDGKPLYGDVFANAFNTVPVLHDLDADEDDGKYWGEIESDGENSDKEESENEAKDIDDKSDVEMDEESTDGSIISKPEVLNTSINNSQHCITPTNIVLRKKITTEEPSSSDLKEEKQLFKVLPEVKTAVGQSIMGSDKNYVVPGNESKIQLQKRKNDGQCKTEPKVKKHKEFKF